MKPRLITTILPAKGFRKSFNKLSAETQQLSAQKEDWFRENAHDPRLKTHRLHGKLDGYWSYSINQQYRVLFKFLNTDSVIYYDVGTHEIYK